ncbi:MAG: glycoside hydrolase family 36 protein [Promethearchaeota archaeon]
MLDIIRNDKEIFEVNNGIIGFKFYLSGQNQGKYDINFKLNNEAKNILKECYSVINFYRRDTNDLLELTSNNYPFEIKLENVEDQIGKGLKVFFISSNNEIQELFFNIQFKIYENQDFILIKLIDIEDNSRDFLAVHSISPLTVKGTKLGLSVNGKSTNLNKITWFKNGFQSWSPCRVFYGYEKDNKGPTLETFNLMYDNQDYKIEGRFYSEYCTCITDLTSRNTLILGFVTFKDQFSRVILDYDNSEDLKLFTAFGCMDGVKLNESSISSSEELFIGIKTNNRGYQGLIDYAKTVKTFIKEKRITLVPIGWCSWYYYYTKITQEDIIKNLKFFTKNKEHLPIDFFQLDDGYFTEIGDFNIINSKFSNGLWWLFQNIKQSGFKGGIWTAPFFAVKKSTLFKNHRSWFLTRSNKLLRTCLNWGASQYSLDLTNIEVLQFLNDFFSKLIFAFKENHNDSINHSVEFFKIDFLHTAVPFKADYKNKTLTRAQLYYNGIRAIREAITDKSFLLGCGAPLGPCVGLVDAMRISYDTAPQWDSNYFESYEIGGGISQPSLKVALINILFRSFMHKYFWINDPDCLMIRRTDTKLTIDEIKLQITIFGLSGGQILISDDMTKLTNKEINDAKLLIPPYNPEDYDPLVIDAFTSELPSIYMLETEEIIGKRYLISVINWEDFEVSKVLDLSEIAPNISFDEKSYYIYDFWNQKFIGEYENNSSIELKEIPPHSCKYLNFIPIDKKTRKIPILLSTNLHITQGCCEIKNFEYKKAQNKLKIDIELIGVREGLIILKLPKNRKIIKYNFDFSIIDPINNIWKLYVKFKDKVSLEVDIA